MTAHCPEREITWTFPAARDLVAMACGVFLKNELPLNSWQRVTFSESDATPFNPIACPRCLRINGAAVRFSPRNSTLKKPPPDAPRRPTDDPESRRAFRQARACDGGPVIESHGGGDTGAWRGSGAFPPLPAGCGGLGLCDRLSARVGVFSKRHETQRRLSAAACLEARVTIHGSPEEATSKSHPSPGGVRTATRSTPCCENSSQ